MRAPRCLGTVSPYGAWFFESPWSSRNAAEDRRGIPAVIVGLQAGTPAPSRLRRRPRTARRGGPTANGVREVESRGFNLGTWSDSPPQSRREYTGARNPRRHSCALLVIQITAPRALLEHLPATDEETIQEEATRVIRRSISVQCVLRPSRMAAALAWSRTWGANARVGLLACSRT
jgi:hypothetical protein